MNVSIFGTLRHLLCKRTVSSAFSLRPQFLATQLYSRRCFASANSDDPSDSSGKKLDDTGNQRQQVIDVNEYYSQYIKEYEQGGFKDDEVGVEWEARRDKRHMPRGRGQTGVMDVDEVVEFLRAERVSDVCTLRMPKSLAYAPFMIIGTPLGRRHLNALTNKLNVAYKTKREVYDSPSMRVEGNDNPEWRVFDLGNVVVHLMMKEARRRYDIEMLWTVGPEHDELTNSLGEMDEYGDRLKKLQKDIDWLSNMDSSEKAVKKQM